MSARRYKLHIPRPDLAVRSRSFRCTSSPNRTHIRWASVWVGATGGGSRAFTMPYPAAPRAPVYLRGSHQGARLYPSGAGKGQDTAPRAVRCAAVGGFVALRMRRTPCGCCRSVLVKQAYSPTRTVAPSFHPSRGGSVAALPPWRVLRIGKWLQHSPPLGLQQSFGPLTTVPIPALEFSSYRPPGGTSNRGAAMGPQWKPSAAGSIGRGRATK